MAELRTHRSFQSVWLLVLSTARNWNSDNVSRLAAAMSCYVILSIAPLGVLIVAIAGIVVGEDAARGQVATQLTALVGSETARSIEIVILSARAPGTGVTTSIFGFAVLAFGASGVFVELQSALNLIWKATPSGPQGFVAALRRRFISLLMVLSVAALLLFSLLLGTAVVTFGSTIGKLLPGGEFALQTLNALVSFLLTLLVFALVFKVVPDAEVAMSDVWPGASITALLFTCGKQLFDVYLRSSSTTATFNVAGSVLALVFWIYGSSQIVFLGAEFTVAYSRRGLGPTQLSSRRLNPKQPET